MVMVDVDAVEAYRQTQSLCRLVWSDGRWPPGTKSSFNEEEGELLQLLWL